MKRNQLEPSKNQRRLVTMGLKALYLSFLGAVIVGGLILPVRCEDSPNTANKNGYSVARSSIKELAGKLLLDSQTEVTQPLQVDRYVNFVNVSTPSLTPASGHSLLFANSGAKQFIAKFSDGSTTILSGTGGAGTITGVTAGTDLTGGGTTGTVTLNVDETKVLTTSSATATYLQSVTAANTYLPLSSATATYLQSVPAASTYLPQSSATATYDQIAAQTTITGTKTFSSSNTFSGQVNISSSIKLSGSAGVSGQLLKSNGPDTVPTWTTAGAQHLFQVIFSSTTTQKSSTSSTYAATSLTATITPTSASSKILIIVSGSMQINTGSVQMFVTVERATTDLSTGSGFCIYRISATPGNSACSFNYLDNPATTSATTYTVYIKNGDNSTTIAWGLGEVQHMTLLEVQ